jgi:hypothetical protein
MAESSRLDCSGKRLGVDTCVHSNIRSVASTRRCMSTGHCYFRILLKATRAVEAAETELAFAQLHLAEFLSTLVCEAKRQEQNKQKVADDVKRGDVADLGLEQWRNDLQSSPQASHWSSEGERRVSAAGCWMLTNL